ncbi:MAG: flagellar basal body L-ring protein FlgH [Rickettsiaceae bacterium H1]|nr:flagellar basal body L-ring protein FlgH [Rickettsiaceae bacterium H1]
MLKYLTYLSVVLLLTGCSSTIERLVDMGKSPILSETNFHEYEAESDDKIKYYNSLWKPKSRYFFKSNRIGDIIKVNINVSDNAKLENESKRSRKTTENLPIPKIFSVNRLLSNVTDSLLDLKSNNSNLGNGKINRNEKINTQIAASVIKILPGGNLAIKGSQEIKVNFEVRQIYLSGIIRPEDINVDNTVDSAKIAELRVSYGGKGHISDVQQPRLGTQLVDILSPF